MFFDGMQGIKELNLIELKDQFTQDFLAKERRFLLTIEKDDAKQSMMLLASHLRHKQLKVVNVELAVKQFILTRRVCPSRYSTHVFLAANLALGTILLALIV
jgi:hypothetical protein